MIVYFITCLCAYGNCMSTCVSLHTSPLCALWRCLSTVRIPFRESRKEKISSRCERRFGTSHEDYEATTTSVWPKIKAMRLSPSLLMSPRALREAVLSFGAVLIGLGAALAFPTVAILLPKFLKAPPAVPEEDAAAAEEPVLSPAEASVVKSRISEFEAMHSEPLNPFKRRVTPPPESAKDNNDEGPSSSESDFSLSSETQPLRRELSTGGARRPLPDFIPTEVATHAIGDEFQPPTAAPLSPSAATAVPVVKRTPRSFSQGVRMADAPAANALGRRTSSDSGGSSSRSSDGGGSLRAASAEPRTLQSLATPPLEKGAPKWVVGPDPRRQRSGQEDDPEREVLMERISRMARPVAPDILGGGASEGAGAGAVFTRSRSLREPPYLY